MKGPLFKWFGSKWLSAKHLPPPVHRHIYEPFAGGAGYSLRYADRAVCIWDTDPHLQVLWRWLIKEATSDDIRNIPLGLAVGTDIRTVGLSVGQATLLKSWQRTNNVGDCWTVSPWGNKPGQWTANTRARVADEVHEIKHWKFFPHENWNAVDATYFIDPMYQFNYQYRQRAHDYADLAFRVDQIHGSCQVIVCEARSQVDGSAPAWLPFVDWQSRVTSRRKVGENSHSKEMIYTRGCVP